MVGRTFIEILEERDFPINELSALARVERPDLARPPLYLHKWWARRLGSVFRTILLGTLLSPNERIWENYYLHHDFSDKIILDPFMGGGTTVVETLSSQPMLRFHILTALRNSSMETGSWRLRLTTQVPGRFVMPFVTIRNANAKPISGI